MKTYRVTLPVVGYRVYQVQAETATDAVRDVLASPNGHEAISDDAKVAFSVVDAPYFRAKAEEVS